MGNSLGCSASGERLVSAARDGDLVEARMLLEFNPCLAKYSTFGGLNSPLHFAAAKGHNEIVMLLLEKGAEVNSRNYCGQVTRADYLSGRTALHFAAVHGHVRCIRLLVADFVPSAPYDMPALSKHGGGKGSSKGSNLDSSSGRKHDQSALLRFINKPADGGITALHMAALNGYFDCVQLLLDLGANVSTVTFHYGSTMNLIGARSTPLHYAACGGNLKCCQILLARGASRLTLNCNGWLPLDIARIWRHDWLEPLLSPKSASVVPTFPPSNYLSLPLMSIVNIASSYLFILLFLLQMNKIMNIGFVLLWAAPFGSLAIDLGRYILDGGYPVVPSHSCEKMGNLSKWGKKKKEERKKERKDVEKEKVKGEENMKKKTKKGREKKKKERKQGRKEREEEKEKRIRGTDKREKRKEQKKMEEKKKRKKEEGCMWAKSYSQFEESVRKYQTCKFSELTGLESDLEAFER
ncbi:hypothetical protein COCNU_10G005190 [Cocos nucifera]|uniref:Uncharacterized protein n=1 Tax=Cocos nucifera TaxID=13894 RepID=A0A8K0ILV5_COCNU|nr:hypothetical protein COCNU_10G005190 [Cocos nucifera]